MAWEIEELKQNVACFTGAEGDCGFGLLLRLLLLLLQKRAFRCFLEPDFVPEVKIKKLK